MTRQRNLTSAVTSQHRWSAADLRHPNEQDYRQQRNQHINIRTTGHEKVSFTVVLGCRGKNLPPMVIFKRKTAIKDKFWLIAYTGKQYKLVSHMSLWPMVCAFKIPTEMNTKGENCSERGQNDWYDDKNSQNSSGNFKHLPNTKLFLPSLLGIFQCECVFW